MSKIVFPHSKVEYVSSTYFLALLAICAEKYLAVTGDVNGFDGTLDESGDIPLFPYCGGCVYGAKILYFAKKRS